MIVDYHMHLRSPREDSEQIDHTVAAVQAFVERAAACGVDEIGFTEHIYYFRQTRRLWHLPYQLERCVHDLDVYCGAVLEAKRRGLPVKLGIEADWVPDAVEELRGLLAGYPFDFVLGSVHWLDGEAVDALPGIWATTPVEEVWRRYFAALAAAAGSGLYDVLSHPDVVKIFRHRPSPSVVAELHGEAAGAIAASGVAVEISTAGLHKPVGELYPDPALLAAFRSAEVPITLASDAHVPSHVGRDLDRAVELARAVGYDTVSVFDGRSRRQEPLG